jgi:hypothetical protein
VLCSTTDPSGPWVAAALRRRGLPGVRLVTVEEIVYSTRFVHRLASGGVTTEVTLPDGAVLGPDLRGALNRVVAVPSAHLAGSEEADRDYAVQEMYALLTSVLASLPGVVNAAGPRGLPGPWLSEAEWLCAAARAGLTGTGFRSGRPATEVVTPDASVLVIGDQVLPAREGWGGVPQAVTQGCRALAERVGARVLGVDLAASGPRWLLVRGNPTPDLRWGGAPVRDAVVDLVSAGGTP